MDGAYLEKNPSWHAEHGAWKAGQIAKILRLGGVQPSSVCEVGCGAGETLKRLRELLPETPEFHGYEVSPQAFALCGRMEKEGLAFHLGDPLLDDGAFFDVVLAIDVFEHVEDCYGFLRRLRGKGQFKVFHIPLDISVLAVMRGRLMRERVQVGHIHYFTKDTALATLTDVGYEIDKWFYTPASYAFSDDSLRGILKSAIARALAAVSADLAAQVMGGYSLMVLAR